jgi:cytochrome c
VEIADKYKDKFAWALDSLPKKIRGGGTGVWGTVTMPAHPAISLNDAHTIVNYILSIRDKNISTLPLKGSYTTSVPPGDNGRGTVIVRAAYTDKGAAPAPALTSESVIALHSPNLSPGSADVLSNVDTKLQTMFAVSLAVLPKANGYIGFKGIDFTGVKQLELGVSANPMQGFVGGIIEIHLDSPTGDLIGQTEIKPVNPFAALMNAANATQNAGGVKPGAGKPGAPPAAAAPPKASAAAPAKRPAAFNLASLFNRPGIKVDIKDIVGQHDVYFVFKNSTAKPAVPLLSLTNIKFNNVKVADPKPNP